MNKGLSIILRQNAPKCIPQTPSKIEEGIRRGGDVRVREAVEGEGEKEVGG